MTAISGPRMSVVVVRDHHGHLIEDALAAISRQTMPPSEVVVVDDGSTDDSLARLQALAARTPWLRIHTHGENRGVNAACNTGLNLVSSDFVLFSAADDRLDLPPQRGHFSADEFVRLMQRNFFYFHVSSVWFNVKLLRALGGFPPELRWHGDLFAAYAAAFEQGATYAPGAVSYFRKGQDSYSVTGASSRAQLDVLRGWLAVTRQPGWERRRAAFVAAAIWPEYSLRAVPVLLSDPGYVTLRLVRRLLWFALWSKIAPLVDARLRNWMRGIRSRYRRSRSSAG